jgi:hypothetical protein
MPLAAHAPAKRNDFPPSIDIDVISHRVEYIGANLAHLRTDDNAVTVHGDHQAGRVEFRRFASHHIGKHPPRPVAHVGVIVEDGR